MRKFSVPVLAAFRFGDQKADLDEILNAPFEDIGEAAERIPALIGWFGFQKGLAQERLINADYHWKELEARAYFDLKNGQFVAKGFGEKVTEEGLKRAVLLVEEVKAASEKYSHCKRDVEWIIGTVDALKAKFELVRSTEATRRMEHEPDRHKAHEH